MKFTVKNLKTLYRPYIKLCSAKFATSVSVFTVMFFITTGCSRVDSRSQDTQGIIKKFESDSVKATLSVDMEELTVADRLRFSITVDYPEDYEPEFPVIQDKLEGLKVVDVHENEPGLTAAGTLETRRDYYIEPFLPGEYEIPAVSVFFRMKGDDSVAVAREIVTEPFTVQVKSVLPPGMDSLAIRDVSGPFDLPTKTLYVVLLALLILIVLIVLVFIMRRRKAKAVAPVPQLSASELARLELERLSAENLVERGMVKEFFYRISGILRRYIENRFGLNAPEQTTEEFLAELARTEVLPSDHKTLLREFLKRCDLVKFAEHQPVSDDIRLTFESCNGFIDATEEKPAECRSD